MTGRDAVLELLCEPLPAACARAASARLLELAAEELAGLVPPGGGLEACATCRRLVLYATGVPAARGKALAAAFPRLLARLDLPGSRAWEGSGFRFPRPVRGLAALHGDRPVAFAAAGLRSGRFTEGHEALGPRRVKLACAEKYFSALGHASVLVRETERLAAMRGALEAASRRMKLRVEAGGEALAACLYLAEYPVPVVSGFPQRLLELPPERLRAAMLALRFFPVTDQAGRLQPYFAAFRDGVSKGQREVEEGFRAALEAALSPSAR